MSIHLDSDLGWQGLLSKHQRVIVDFTATWCGPCKKIGPVFEKLAAETKGLTFVKVDVDDCQETAQKCDVTAMPTFQVFIDGKKVAELLGANEAELKALVEKHKAAPTEEPAAPAPAAAPAPTPAAAPAAAAVVKKAIHMEKDSEWAELLTKHQRLIVDFSATWCGPCKKISPVFEKLATETDGLAFVKIDVDECQETAQKCDISAMPTFQVYVDGKKVAEMLGANEAELKSMIEKHKAH